MAYSVWMTCGCRADGVGTVDGTTDHVVCPNHPEATPERRQLVGDRVEGPVEFMWEGEWTDLADLAAFAVRLSARGWETASASELRLKELVAGKLRALPQHQKPADEKSLEPDGEIRERMRAFTREWLAKKARQQPTITTPGRFQTLEEEGDDDD